jgi:OOP family OmpA-OmpF porin
MKAKIAVIGAALVAASAFSTAAMAEGYVGGAIGQSNANYDCAGTLTCDNTDTAFKVYGGYMFMPYLGVEGAYFDLGKAKASFFDPGFGNVAGEIKANGFALYAVGAYPIQDFLLFGKVGAASTKVKVTAAAAGLSASDSETNTDIVWGLGAGYNIGKNFGVRLEWERFRAKFQGEKSDIDMYSLGAHFRF